MSRVAASPQAVREPRRLTYLKLDFSPEARLSRVFAAGGEVAYNPTRHN
jgi:hypothetical protein